MPIAEAAAAHANGSATFAVKRKPDAIADTMTDTNIMACSPLAAVVRWAPARYVNGNAPSAPDPTAKHTPITI